MSGKMDELEHILGRVSDSIAAAQAYYQIWFTLRGENKALPDYYKDMNDYRYVDFFHAINAGTYKLMFIEFGCLFDTDDRSTSIRSLKEKLNEINRKDLSSYIEKELTGYEKLVSNLITIRSKLMAHKEIGAFSEDVHKENGVVPNEIGKLINTCASLINHIDEEVYGSNGYLLCSASTLRYERATFSMLKVLKKGRNS
jgi:hypothetical protein